MPAPDSPANLALNQIQTNELTVVQQVKKEVLWLGRKVAALAKFAIPLALPAAQFAIPLALYVLSEKVFEACSIILFSLMIADLIAVELMTSIKDSDHEGLRTLSNKFENYRTPMMKAFAYLSCPVGIMFLGAGIAKAMDLSWPTMHAWKKLSIAFGIGSVMMALYQKLALAIIEIRSQVTTPANTLPQSQTNATSPEQPPGDTTPPEQPSVNPAAISDQPPSQQELPENTPVSQ
jgi:hypothetical protein